MEGIKDEITERLENKEIDDDNLKPNLLCINQYQLY